MHELPRQLDDLGVWLFNVRQLANDVRLASRCDFAIVGEGCHHFFVPKILAPGFELLWCLTELLPQLGQGRPETVRVEVRQARSREGVFEDGANRCGVAPVACAPALKPRIGDWRQA